MHLVSSPPRLPATFHYSHTHLPTQTHLLPFSPWLTSTTHRESLREPWNLNKDELINFQSKWASRERGYYLYAEWWSLCVPMERAPLVGFGRNSAALMYKMRERDGDGGNVHKLDCSPVSLSLRAGRWSLFGSKMYKFLLTTFYFIYFFCQRVSV